MRSTVTGVAGLEHVPESIRSLHRLGRADYADLSTLHTPSATEHSPEEWARAVLEEGRSVRRFGFIPWRVLLGLRLGPSYAPGYVHGWRIAGGGDDWIRLETASWLMACNAVARIAEGQVSVALFVRYDHPVARPWWSLLAPVHRHLMPVILHQGHHVLTSPTAASASRPVEAVR